MLFICISTVSSAYNITSSGTLEYSNDTEQTVSVGPYTLLKTIQMDRNYTGSWTIGFDMRGQFDYYATYGKIYKNGLPIGIEQMYIYSSWATFNQTFTNITINNTDTIELWGYRISYLGYVRDFRIYFDYDPTTLYNPINNSEDYFNYPDFTHETHFSWEEIPNLNYNIKIAKDNGFNLLTIDKTISTNYTTESLEPATYFWKVRLYNTTTETYGNYSNVSTFTLIRNASTGTGTRIEGMVYELVDNSPVMLSEATVYIRNEALNCSNSMVTGSNGYYLFSDLEDNMTYSLSVKKTGYEDSVTEYATTVLDEAIQKNILLTKCISSFNCGFITQPVTFTVRNLFDDEFPGVTVTVYKGDELTAFDIGLTDSGGSITFMLNKDQKYRVTFEGGGIASMITYYAYGSQTNYRIVVVSGFPDGGNRLEYISTNLSASTINATHSNLSLVYSDSIGSTTSINFYTTNLTTGATCWSNSTASNATLSCAVLSTGTYRYGFTAVSSVYGTFRQDKVHNFGAGTSAGNPLYGKVDSTLLNWASIMVLIFVSAMFSVKSVKFGAVVIPAMALVLWSMHWLQVNFLLLSTALVIGIMVYMRMSEHKVEY